MDELLNLSQFLTKSKRGGDKIVYEGHGYNYKDTFKEIKNWRCCKRLCKSFLKTTLLLDLVSISDHSHGRDDDGMREDCVMTVIKKRALDTS
jgi:hypothetical protein